MINEKGENNMQKLTIVTIAGQKYQHFIEDWKRRIPKNTPYIIEEDDSKGLYEAKKNVLDKVETEYVWITDVDDKIIGVPTLLDDLDVADAIQVANGCGVWTYIFRTDYLRKVYNEIEKAKKDSNISTLNIVSCEDIIVYLAMEHIPHSYEYRVAPNSYLEHTVNDTSMTNSYVYTLEKIKRLYCNFEDLVKVSSILNKEETKRIILVNCYNQYWNIYRNKMSSQWEKELADKFILGEYAKAFEALR